VQLQSVKDAGLLSRLHILYDNQGKYFGLLFMEQNPVRFSMLLGIIGRQLCSHTSLIILNTLKGYKGIEGISTNFALLVLDLLSWYCSI